MSTHKIKVDLSIEGSLVADNDVTVGGNLGVIGDLLVESNSNLNGNVNIGANAAIGGAMTVEESITSNSIMQSNGFSFFLGTNNQVLLDGAGRKPLADFVTNSNFKIVQHDLGDRRAIDVITSSIGDPDYSVTANGGTIILESNSTNDLTLLFWAPDFERGDILTLVNRSTAKISLRKSINLGTNDGEEMLKLINGTETSIIDPLTRVRMQRTQIGLNWVWYEI